jgi:hypothetical protein
MHSGINSTDVESKGIGGGRETQRRRLSPSMDLFGNVATSMTTKGSRGRRRGFNESEGEEEEEVESYPRGEKTEELKEEFEEEDAIPGHSFEM